MWNPITGEIIYLIKADHLWSRLRHTITLVLHLLNHDRSKGDASSHVTELCAEDSLARKLSILTNALNQGKPIRVDDLLSLRSDNEVNANSPCFKYFILAIFHSIITANIFAGRIVLTSS